MRQHPFSSAIMDQIKALHFLNNWRGPLAIFEDWAVIFSFISLSVWTPHFYPLTLLIIGSRQRALASLFHESCHTTLMKHRRFNREVGKWGTGYAIFQEYRTYRKSHVAQHHIFLGNPKRDPDFVNYREEGVLQVQSKKEFFQKFILRTLLLMNVPQYLMYLWKNRLKNIARFPIELFNLLIFHGALAAILTTIAGPWGYALYWLLPYFTSFQIIGFLSEISEHYPLYLTAKTPLELTRNRFASWWERLFVGMHADHFHLTHHLFVGLPFWHLKKAHHILMKDSTYASFNQIQGGILSSPKGRISSLRQIITFIEDQQKP